MTAEGMTSKEELASLEQEIKRLEARKRDLYRQSVDAPESEKLCENYFAEMLAEPEVFKTLEYPIEINGITFTGEFRSRSYVKPGSLVRVRPCAAEFESKTFLGVYLGDYARSVGCSRNSKTGVLEVYVSGHNPTIWIPSRQSIVYGFNSWWGKIETEEQFREISDEAIDGVWYVQALKSLQKEGSNAQG